MDMLATWILLRCNRQNPQNKEMGYEMTFKPEKKNHKQARQTQARQHQPDINTNTHPTRISGLVYCDDIALSTENYEDMQDLIGAVSEFMSTFGIQLNTKKSLYTAQARDHQNTPPPQYHNEPHHRGHMDRRH